MHNQEASSYILSLGIDVLYSYMSNNCFVKE
jgi:hypothetical protein